MKNSVYINTGEKLSNKKEKYSVYKKSDNNLKYILRDNPKLEIKDKINYISVLPGSGKTRWAKEKIRKGMARKEPKYIYLFISPTISLLEEVYGYLIKDNEVDSEKVHIYHNKNTTKVLDKFIHEISVAKLGSTFFITKDLYTKIQVLPRREKIFAVFDEASEFNISSYSFTIEDGENAKFFKKNIYLELQSKNIRVTGSCPELNSKEDVHDFFEMHCKTRALQDYGFRSIESKNLEFYRMLQKIADPNYSVFTMLKKKEYAFFNFVAPENVFSGFSEVYLMSAFFEYSELYHILNKVKYKLVDKSYLINRRRQEKISRNFKLLKIHPLINKDSNLSSELIKNTFSYTGKLSSLESKVTALEDSLLKLSIPRHKVAEITKRILLDKKASIHSDLPDDLIKFRKQCSSVLNFLAERAKVIVKEKKAKTLLVVNRDSSTLTKKITWKSIPPKSHGTNKYSRYNALVFLCAMNPTPSLNLFYKEFLPAYDPETSWIVTNIIQAITRTRIRRTNNTKPIHLIVATTKTAELLQDFINKNILRSTFELINNEHCVNANLVSYNKIENLRSYENRRTPFSVRNYLYKNNSEFSKYKSRCNTINTTLRRGVEKEKEKELLEEKKELLEKMRVMVKQKQDEYKKHGVQALTNLKGSV